MKFNIIMLSLILLSSLGFRHKENEDGKNKKITSIYTAYIGTSSMNYSNDNIATAGGGDIGGRILFRINGNPLFFHSTGGIMMPINQYLKPRRNVISIEGKHEKTLYLKIVTMKENTLQALILKSAIPPEKMSNIWTTDFISDITYQLPIYNRKNLIQKKDKKQIKKEIVKFLNNINEHMIKHETSKLLPKITKGMKIWQYQAYNLKDEEIMHVIKFSDKFYSNKANLFEKYKESTLNYVYGPNIILVYVGFDAKFDEYSGSNYSESSYLFTYKQQDKIKFLPEMRFAYLSGEWVLWH